MGHIPNISRIESDGTETPMTLSAKVCEWKRNGDGGYYVKCGDFRVIMDEQRDFDDNTGHDFIFCPYCGGKLIKKEGEHVLQDGIDSGKADSVILRCRVKVPDSVLRRAANLISIDCDKCQLSFGNEHLKVYKNSSGEHEIEAHMNNNGVLLCWSTMSSSHVTSLLRKIIKQNSAPRERKK